MIWADRNLEHYIHINFVILLFFPDGSIEEKQVTKDNEGRETTTVIKKSGEDCYTVTTIKHPDGREERQESNSCPQLNDFSRSFSGQLGSLARESIVDRIFKF